MRYHGELSRALLADLKNFELIPVVIERTARGITAVISSPANTRLRAAAKQRGMQCYGAGE
jgi:hypothetical protein